MANFSRRLCSTFLCYYIGITGCQIDRSIAYIYMDMETCRACLKKGPDILNIHQNNCDLFYKECISLQIDSEDDSPHGICLSCFDILNNFFFFKRLCIDSNKTLQMKFQREEIYIKSEILQDNYKNDVKNVELKYMKSESQDYIKTEDVKIEYEDTRISSGDNSIKTCTENNKNKQDSASDSINPTQKTILKPFKCKHCSKSFITKSKLNCHIDSHKIIADIKCNICNKMFRSSAYFKQHLLNHSFNKSEKGGYKCDICSKSFVYKYYLTQHLETHKEFPDLKCEICDKMFKSSRYYREHLSMHTSNNIEYGHKCEHCSKRFMQKSNLIQHLETHKEIADIKCEFCDKMFKSKRYFSKHMLQHSSEYEGKKKIKCEFCPQSYTSSFRLTQHMQIHKEIQGIKCENCDKTFVSKVDFKKHLLTSHSNTMNGEKQYKCDHCSKTFAWKFKIVLHLEIHKEYPDLKCEICGKMFKSRICFRRHSLSHSGKRVYKIKYKCLECPKQFMTQDTLAIHMESHKTCADLQCPFCNRMFKLSRSLKRHLLSSHKVVNYNN